MKIIKSNTNFISTEEKETIINYDYLTKTWYMDSSIPKHFNQAQKKGWEVVEEIVNENNLVISMRLKTTGTGISIRNPHIKRTVTEEQREQARVRLEEVRALRRS